MTVRLFTEYFFTLWAVAKKTIDGCVRANRSTKIGERCTAVRIDHALVAPNPANKHPAAVALWMDCAAHVVAEDGGLHVAHFALSQIDSGRVKTADVIAFCQE